MNREIEVVEIFLMNINDEEKCKKLNEFLLSCYNEMIAQEENMRPEVMHNLAQAYQLAKNYLRKIENNLLD
ncbi:MAG TPA: hypothetical protein PK657_01305 [Legionella sp.]|nr:hypothetical protein [Legionella sp.]